MKIGYSLFLGEIIEAIKIDYTDCKNFQIVCPKCKEPVFKVVRNNNDETIDYLSHYEKDKSYVQDCELRVSKLDDTFIQKLNTNSQNQKLEYFLSVLKESIIENEFKSKEIPKPHNHYLSQIKRSKAIAKFREMVFDFSMKHPIYWSEETINEILEDYIGEIKSISGSFYETSFSLQIQKRIAKDIWQHLLTPKTKENYNFLFNYAYYFLITRLEEAAKVRTSNNWEVILHNSMVQIMQKSKDKGLQILTSLGNHPMPENYDGDAPTLFEKLPAEISYEMIGVLLRLPYFEIIKKYNFNFSGDLIMKTV